MQEKKNNRTKVVTFRLTTAEYRQMSNKCRATTCRKLSDYMRKVLLEGKVTVFTRNQSLDAFMAEMIKLRNELNAIGNNYNQEIHKLHTLQFIPEIKSWILLNEAGKQVLFKKIDEIKSCINQFASSW